MSTGLNVCPADAAPSRSDWSSTTMFLQKVCLHDAPEPGCFVPHFLEKRLKLTFFQGCYKGGVIGLNSQLTDPDGQLHLAVQIDHFPILENLFAPVCQLFAGADVFHLVEVVQQRFQTSKFTNQRRCTFTAYSDSRNIIDGIARQREHVAD